MGSFLSRYLGWWLGTDKAAQPLPRPWPARLPQGQDPGQVLSVHRSPRARSRRARSRRARARSSRLQDNSPALYRSLTRRALVSQAWRCFPNWLLLHHFMGLRFSRHRKTFRKTRPWNGRHPRRRRSLVTIQITLPERTGSFYTCLPSPEQPDLCASETRLRPIRKKKELRRASLV
ncbi:POM121-like protein 2 isoform X1 [Moschus berezovskii]|uniref:POM121-like protein 2 isoform X1 n=1 Tax=Moschus berezovskii TaxID=68408 RepID=UPI0024453136|nr:POM121-like protein 2 isoform X1 [Moschus berezovskii]